MRRQVFPAIHGVFDEHRTSHPDQGSGSWGDLSTARHPRDTAPELEVVLLKKNPLFWSCPLSNRWLVVSTGIRVSYEPWFGNDRQAIAYTNTHYSSAYVPSAEHLSLKQKIYAFKGGTIVMTLPTPPHRCPPSTYERACLMANHFQKHKIPAKIVILDPKPRISPIGGGQPMAPEIIDNLCFMLVNTDPLVAISVKFEHKMGPEGHLVQTLTDDNDRRQALWQEDLLWYGSKIADMVGS